MVAWHVVPGTGADATQAGSPARPPHQVCSSAARSAPWPSFGTKLDLTQAFASSAENYQFVSCGFSVLNYSLRVSQRVPGLRNWGGSGRKGIPQPQVAHPSSRAAETHPASAASSPPSSSLWDFPWLISDVKLTKRQNKKNPTKLTSLLPTQSPNQFSIPKSKALLLHEDGTTQPGPGQSTLTKASSASRDLHLNRTTSLQVFMTKSFCAEGAMPSFFCFKTTHWVGVFFHGKECIALSLYSLELT